MSGKSICDECKIILLDNALKNFSGDKNSLDIENAVIIGDTEITIPYNTNSGTRFYDYYADVNYCVCCGKKI